VRIGKRKSVDVFLLPKTRNFFLFPPPSARKRGKKESNGLSLFPPVEKEEGEGTPSVQPFRWKELLSGRRGRRHSHPFIRKVLSNEKKRAWRSLSLSRVAIVTFSFSPPPERGGGKLLPFLFF